MNYRNLTPDQDCQTKLPILHKHNIKYKLLLWQLVMRKEINISYGIQQYL